MKKTWSISTTVRNPERLQSFLLTLQEIEGKEWNNETQKEFQIRLIKNRFYGFGNTQFYNGLSQDQVELIDDIKNTISLDKAKEIFETKNYKDSAMRGRTSYKPLEKLGLAMIKDQKVKITTLGIDFIKGKYDLGDVYLKSFLKWQYPNPVDRDFRDDEIYNLKPFVLTLHLINEVNKICEKQNIRAKGISKLEFEIFGQTLLNYKDLKPQAKALVDFREKLEKIKVHEKKKVFINDYIDSFLCEYSNVEFGNLKDYADNIIRYFRLTRFISIRGGGYYIDLEPRRMVEIESLLKTYDGSSENFTKEEYNTYISDINLPILPWEERSKLIQIFSSLVKEIAKLQKTLNLKQDSFSMPKSTNDIKLEISKLRNFRQKLQNAILKNRLTNISSIDEVIQSLQNIRKDALKPSVALEKYITMALNIINDALEIKANSLVGDDNEVIFTAPANKPDIECFYKNFNSICEVTMLVSRDQWYNEGQPVMRHFRDFEDKSKQKENYCLFVAPKLHRDTINTFWMSLKYEFEGRKQKIVPLTITQIIDILYLIKELKEAKKSFFHSDFKVLLEKIIAISNNVNNSEDWLKQIPREISNFKKLLLCS